MVQVLYVERIPSSIYFTAFNVISVTLLLLLLFFSHLRHLKHLCSGGREDLTHQICTWRVSYEKWNISSNYLKKLSQKLI